MKDTSIKHCDCNSAVIAVAHDTKIKGVYLQSGGEVANAGTLLFRHYNSPRANHLVANGHILKLDRLISPTTKTHTATNPEPGVCVFYRRDMNMIGADFIVFASEHEIFDIVETQHIYLCIANTWVYCAFNEDSNKREWQLLENLFQTQTVGD